MTLATVFIFFVFSTLGLGLVYVSQAYLKLSAYQKNTVLSAFSAENGVKQGFAHLTGRIAERDSPLILSESLYRDLKDDALRGGTIVFEKILDISLPDYFQESWEGQAWSGATDFGPAAVIDLENYFVAEAKGEIAAEGSPLGNRCKKRSSLAVRLRLAAGYIPLSYFPFLMTESSSFERIRELRMGGQLVFLPLRSNTVYPAMLSTDLPLIPADISPLLGKALNIKIFSPENLSAAELRAALGLEPTRDPVPEGVYLIKNDLGLGGVYVHGDLQEMVLAVEAGYQIISFRQNEETWTLRYNPAQSLTEFSSPAETLTYDLVPLGIIMVNGKISSLGGGIPTPAGAPILVRDQEVSSILQGVSLTIVSSDQTAISSHLIHEGLKWQDGIPYIKDSATQLVVYATGKDFWSEEDREGKIIIGDDAPNEIKIQASLTARDGFSLMGDSRAAWIIGGLQTASLDIYDNIVKIMPDERLLTHLLTPQISPATAYPLLFVLGLTAFQWNEF